MSTKARKLSVFDNITLDGYFTDSSSDMSWAHRDDAEWRAFVAGNASSGGALLFGRITYQMMASFWPTPMAAQNMPAVAEGMNSAPKFVASKTLQDASWSNTTILRGDLISEVQKLKSQPGPDIVILGSGSIVAQLTEAGLIDEYRLVIVPTILGGGRALFEGVKTRPSLRLTSIRSFENGNLLLTYLRQASGVLPRSA